MIYISDEEIDQDHMYEIMYNFNLKGENVEKGDYLVYLKHDGVVSKRSHKRDCYWEDEYKAIKDTKLVRKLHKKNIVESFEHKKQKYLIVPLDYDWYYDDEVY